MGFLLNACHTIYPILISILSINTFYSFIKSLFNLRVLLLCLLYDLPPSIILPLLSSFLLFKLGRAITGAAKGAATATSLGGKIET